MCTLARVEKKSHKALRKCLTLAEDSLRTKMWKKILVLSILLTNLEQSMSQCSSGNLLRIGGLTCQDKSEIIQKHNELRQQVAQGNVANQPSALNMLETVWDNELAVKAQTHANKCSVNLDQYESRRVARFEVGQNIAWTTVSSRPGSQGDRPDFPNAIQSWFDEVINYNYNTNSGNGNSVGHYIQEVWAKTYAVGCGYVFYQSGLFYNKLYVCNYGPAGNTNEELPYKSGSPACTLPHTSNSLQYSALCRMAGTQYGNC